MLLAASFILAGTQAFADSITVTNSTDATALAEALVGAGITIVGTPTFTSGGVSNQQGTFTVNPGGGSPLPVLPFSSGIILTNGSITNVPGPNNTESASTNLGLPGTAALSALDGQTTYDADVLSFQFMSNSTTMSFQYAFGSEEYGEWEGLFNDVFAFFLDGTNIATVPGGSTPVSINTVNCGNFGPNGPVQPASNAQYFDANSATSACWGNGATAVNLQYDGIAGGVFADPLYATATLVPGQVYTIQLAIADGGDGNLDSGVFLAGGSFTSAPPPSAVPEPASLVLLGSGLMYAVRRRRSGKSA